MYGKKKHRYHPYRRGINMSSENGKVGWRVHEWYPQVGIGRSTTYNLIEQGKIKIVKVGRATIIVTPPSEFLASLDALETR